MNREKTEDLTELIEQTVLLFRRLRVVSMEIHQDAIPIAGQRGVLVDLANGGPQTVPSLARARGVSRQNIQVLIDRFLSEGVVELNENPAHRRSKLVELTSKGRKLTNEIRKRETEMLTSLNVNLTSSEIRNAANVLRKFRDSLKTIPVGPE